MCDLNKYPESVKNAMESLEEIDNLGPDFTEDSIHNYSKNPFWLATQNIKAQYKADQIKADQVKVAQEIAAEENALQAIMDASETTNKLNTGIITGFVAYEEVGFSIVDADQEVCEVLNMGKKVELAKEIKSFTDIIKKIRSDFKCQFPWMFGFLTVSDGSRECIHQVFKSLPVLTMSVVGNSVVMYSKWDGTNIDKFWIEMKKTSDDLEEIFGEKKTKRQVDFDEIPTKNAWQIKQSLEDSGYDYSFNNKYIKSNKKKYGEKPQTYRGSNKIILTEVKSVEIYDWGFRIETETPISMVAIKNTYYEQGVFNSRNLQNDLNNYYGTGAVLEFEMPEAALDIKLLKYYWNKDSSTSDKFDDILFDNDNSKTEILDVGQHDYDIVDFD